MVVSKELFIYALVLRVFCIAMSVYIVHRQGKQIQGDYPKVRLLLFGVSCIVLAGNVVPFLFDIDHLINNSLQLLRTYIFSNATSTFMTILGMFILYKFDKRLAQ